MVKQKKLTVQQEAFAQCLADGLSQADAYRVAYPKSKNWTASALYAQASRTAADPKIDARVTELREILEKSQIWNRERSVVVLAEVAGGVTIVDPDGTSRRVHYKASDRVAAVKELNVMHGWNAPQKIDHTSSDGSMTPASVDSSLVAALVDKLTG